MIIHYWLSRRVEGCGVPQIIMASLGCCFVEGGNIHARHSSFLSMVLLWVTLLAVSVPEKVSDEGHLKA